MAVDKITPEMLHEWYLEAVRCIDPDNYNKKAEVPYDKLNEDQKFLDKYICDKVNHHITFCKYLKDFRDEFQKKVELDLLEELSKKDVIDFDDERKKRTSSKMRAAFVRSVKEVSS